MRRVLQATDAYWNCSLCRSIPSSWFNKASASHISTQSYRQGLHIALFQAARASVISRAATTRASLSTQQSNFSEGIDKSFPRSSEGVSASGHSDEDLQLIELPKATNVRVKKAEFIKSSTSLEQCPKSRLPEFALIGRSNVGKSSLINMLTGQASLAKVSKTPGKTIYINHFLINDSWYLVDLPGYGYAERSKTSRLEWSKFTKDYFLKRETLANVLLLVDASVPTQQADLECANWLAEAQVPFSLVFTKVDKRKKRCPSPEENMQAFQEELLKEWDAVPNVITTSCRTGDGRQDLLHYIAQLRNLFNGELPPQRAKAEPDQGHEQPPAQA